MGRISSLRRCCLALLAIAAMGKVRPHKLMALSLRFPLLDERRRALTLVYSMGMRPIASPGLYALCLIATLFGVNGCSKLVQGESKVRVELQVYSGRPNPSWELSASDVAELARRMTDLPRSRQPFVEGGLGYGGFVIWNPEKAAGLPTQIYVFNGIGMPEKEGITAYQDVHDIEGWLLEQARQHGYGALLSEVGKKAVP